MYAVISREKIHLPAGSVMRMPATWQDYCALQQSRGNSSLPRIKFRSGELLLMSPLPRHGREANLLADVVKVLLDRQNRNYEAFTPITMEIPEVGGIEPDYCFYIDHWEAVAGKDRIDWQRDPPPDLVIEIDVTTYTAVEDYLPYRIPEVWLFKNRALNIFALERDTYNPQPQSRFFPDVDLAAVIAQVVERANTQGTGMALQDLRRQFIP